MAESSGQRTEQPTPRRLEKARREGQFPTSREFVSAVQFIGFLAVATGFGAAWFKQIRILFRQLLTRAFTLQFTPQFNSQLTPAGLLAIVHQLILPVLAPLLAGGAALALLVLLVQLGSNRFGVSLAKLVPDIERLNFLARIRNLPGQNVPPFLQAVILLPLIGWVVYYEITENLDQLLALSWLSAPAGLLRVTATIETLLWRAAALFLVAGLIDLVWQRRRYTQQLRMSKQEVREESKEQQGNPQIKMRIRRLQRDLARRNMMKEIPKATAVIVNPTHYAVALRYALDSGGAPKVVAKGKNYLALRIRKKALEHQVPIVENPPLARALYESADVGQEIPSSLYRAVAEILAYIYRLMNGRLPG
jgi:flagellar biosynthetic protein FlhB